MEIYFFQRNGKFSLLHSINVTQSKLIMNQLKITMYKKYYYIKYYIFENNSIIFLMSADVERRKFGTRRTFSRI